MYADDTTIYFNLKNFNPETLNNEIHSELEKISILLKMNKLSLNKQNTKMMVFYRQQKHIKELNIAINGAKINRGINEKISWSHHVDIVKKKISKLIGILCRLKNIFSFETLETLYNSLIASYLNYGFYYGVLSHTRCLLFKKRLSD